MSPLDTRLKEKRQKFKLTQQQIADALKINQVTYQGYEKGKHEPDLKTLLKLADLFETSTDYLLGRYD
jgi:transcriptional regulator with XRE-family HTH domain